MELNHLRGGGLKHRAILYVWEERTKQTLFFNPFVMEGKHRKIIWFQLHSQETKIHSRAGNSQPISNFKQNVMANLQTA